MSEVSSPGVDYSQREGDSLIDYEEHTSSSLRLLNMSASVCVAFCYLLFKAAQWCVCVCWKQDVLYYYDYYLIH